MRRISRKTRAAAPTRVGITSSNRFMMYRYISLPSAASLLVEPDGRQILVQVMARADLPALHIGPVRDDTVPPRRHEHMRLGIEHVVLEFAHQGALFGEIGLMQQLLIKVDFLLVLIIAVVLGIDRMRQK